MSPSRRLPALPKVELEVVCEKTGDGPGFLTLRRVDLARVGEDGEKSATFAYDMVERSALDAAVMVAHYEEGGRTFVYLRSSIRPPVALRSKHSAALWELPAGLIEPGESATAAAARELEEELGLRVEENDLLPLGSPSFPAPAFIAETHYFFHVRVDPKTRREPPGDGSPLEQGAMIVAARLDEILDACRRGEICDAKTELAVRRLAEILPE